MNFRLFIIDRLFAASGLQLPEGQQGYELGYRGKEIDLGPIGGFLC